VRTSVADPHDLEALGTRCDISSDDLESRREDLENLTHGTDPRRSTDMLSHKERELLEL